MTIDQFSIALPLVFVILQCLSIWLAPEGWHTAAAIPAFSMLAAMAMLIYGIAMDAPAAQTWFMIGLPVATAYLAVLFPMILMHRSRLTAAMA